MTARAIAALSGSLASDLARRTSLSTPNDALRHAAPSGSNREISARSFDDGHGARCTDPVCHHDHTSSVTNGMYGANRRNITDRAACIARFAEAAAASPWSP